MVPVEKNAADKERGKKPKKIKIKRQKNTKKKEKERERFQTKQSITLLLILHHMIHTIIQLPLAIVAPMYLQFM